MSECADIYAAIARLERKVDSIPRVNEQAIINKAIAGAKQLLKPEIAAAAAVGFVAQQQAGDALREAGRAAQLATNAGGVANNALGKVLGLIGTVSGLLALYGVVEILPARIDGVERYIDSVAADLSKLFGIVGGVKAIAQKAQRTADEGVQLAKDANAAIPPVRAAAQNSTTHC
ncbi:hypothetical protein [Gloeocapsopsis dulcis]|uniref:Uncharacterized protein n=1 Tax=Gloeocapsopsis dulcis AAB1 = 1H9 TaxID=1433147 RepID=A0A6N8G3H9_9CHRO|nr:hypothetical protein [Gloeocapsopsis dulcis]MUL39342.1 hypothetical protein [Gloeocapsopsis dulcis AAB1 = 1H9]WNN89702.1 hypothetical protein P0S91_00975 [Gloeocapsopsis dulcis]